MKTKKIRMVAFNNKGEIVQKKYIDFTTGIIKERNEENMQVCEWKLEKIVDAFGSIERYIDYNMRVWNFKLLDSIN